MLRFIILLSLCFVIKESKSQNWELFPVNQKNFYRIQTSDSLISSRSTEFSYQLGNEIIYFFTNGIYEYCKPDELINYANLPLDSIILNDSAHIFINGQDSFYFYHNAPIGKSWFIPLGDWTSNYNRVHISYDSIYLGTFLGVSDSLKLYSIQCYSNNNPVANPLNDKKYVLSKHYGFIEAVFFNDSYSSSLPPAIPPHHEVLMGFKNDSISAGLPSPNADDFLPYQPGDIYKWYSYFDAGIPVSLDKEYWYRDSIYEVINLPDTFIYRFHRHVQERYYDSTGLVEKFYWAYNQQKIIYKKGLQKLLNGQTQYISLVDNFLGFPPNSIWETSYFKPNLINGKTSFEFSISTDYTYLDTNSCSIYSITDNVEYIQLNQLLGVTTIYSGYNWSSHSETLIGYNTAKAGTGGNHFPIGIDEPGNFRNISIFPNPTSNHVFVQGIPSGKPFIYSLYSIDGKLLQKNEISENKISVPEIEKGLYLLIIQIDNASFRTKILIQ